MSNKNEKFLIPSSELVEKITNDIIDNANTNKYTLNEGILETWSDIKKNGQLYDITFNKHNENTIEYTIWFKHKQKSRSVKKRIPIEQINNAEFKQKVVQSITIELFGENNNNISQYLNDKDELNIYYYNNLIKPDVLNLYKINLKNNKEKPEISTANKTELDKIMSDQIKIKSNKKSFNLIIFLKKWPTPNSNRITVISGGKKRKRTTKKRKY